MHPAMSRPAVSQASRIALRSWRQSILRPCRSALPALAARSPAPTARLSRPAFSTWPARSRGIMPDTENPAKEAEKTETTVTPADLTDAQYHELADVYLEHVLTRFEELQDERGDLDVEYSAGVMTITVPDKGTYVVNKQPPNKQIWLSSPISGPKRYDWCVIGESQEDKEGTASGGWIYARDGSDLNQVFLEELGIDLSASVAE